MIAGVLLLVYHYYRRYNIEQVRPYLNVQRI